jgi:hypothetical protein
MILDQLPDITLIYSELLEHFQTGSGHGARWKNPKRRFTKSQEMVLVFTRRTKIAAGVKGALGFGLSHRYVAAGVIWACTVHITSLEITECTNSPRWLRQLFQSLSHLLQAPILNLKDPLTWWHMANLTDTRLNSQHSTKCCIRYKLNYRKR